jgi:excisionase family DNA binding protein
LQSYRNEEFPARSERILSDPYSDNPSFEPLLDSEQAARLLRIHPKTLQRMARNGSINGVQIGKLWRFRASALNEWLSGKGV